MTGLRKLDDVRYLSTAKGRAIAIPVDLDNQVHNLFVKSNNIVQKTAMSWRLSARNAARRDSMVTASRDYRNIIERLQVLFVCAWNALSLSNHWSSKNVPIPECRTSCQPWRTVCARWSRPSYQSWWTCCIAPSCSFLKTRTRARSARAAGLSASKARFNDLSDERVQSESDNLPNSCRLIKHTKQLLEENEERLCIKVLQTLREMMTKDRGYGEKVGKSEETCRHKHTSCRRT